MEDKNGQFDVNDEKDLLREDAMLWKKVSEIDTKEEYQVYLSKFPDGMRKEDAVRRLSYISEEEVWETAKRYDTSSSYEDYLRYYPAGRHVYEAKDALVRLEVYSSKETEIKKWNSALIVNSIDSYTKYIADNPSSPFVSEAKSRIETLKGRRNGVVWGVVVGLVLAIIIVFAVLLSAVRFINVSKSALQFDGDGGKEKVEVHSDGEWRISPASSATWVQFVKNGPRSMTVTVPANPNKYGRNTYVVLKAGLRRCKVEIQQSKKIVRLSVDKKDVSINGAGGAVSINVTCNDSWTFKTAPYENYSSWLTVSRDGNTLKFSATKNNTNSERGAKITIVADDKSVDISVSQKTSNTYLRVSSSSVSLDNSGTLKSITVSTDGGWTCSSSSSWLITRMNGSNLEVSAPKNEGSARSATVDIVAGTFKKTITVKQAAAGPSASIEKVWLEHNIYSGGVKGMYVHVKLYTSRMLHKTGQVACYFYFSNGKALKDYNGYYSTSNGNVANHITITPGYEEAVYEDAKIFMPYSEFHLSSSADLYVNVAVFCGNTQISTVSSNISFKINF